MELVKCVQRANPFATPMLIERTFELENDPSLLQWVTYCAVVHCQEVFAYKRKGSEERLHDLWSIGVGGHVNDETLNDAVLRELDEELHIEVVHPVFLGCIHDPVDRVGAVHLGFAYVVEVYRKPPSKEETSDFEWVTDMGDKTWENWSKILWSKLHEGGYVTRR